MTDIHMPVMLGEVIKALDVEKDSKILDMTYGRGGHSKAILKQMGQNGHLTVVDCDKAAIDNAKSAFLDEPRVEIIHEKHEHSLVEIEKRNRRFDGILMDLGVSSPQLDEGGRGFSFRHDGPLDMRMDQRQLVTAAMWLNQVNEKEMANCLWQYGEERQSRKIAAAICENRPVETTKQLKDIIHAVKRRKPGQKTDPATKTFQAIRICVNQELTQLASTLPRLLNVMNVGGVLAVITFQGLEQKVLKDFVRKYKTDKRNKYAKHLPLANQAKLNVLERVKPTRTEILANIRARSAQLTVMERVQ